jgi:hypothetical protein
LQAGKLEGLKLEQLSAAAKSQQPETSSQKLLNTESLNLET